MSYDNVAVSDLKKNDVDIYGSRIVPGKQNILSGGRHLLSGDRHLIYLAFVDRVTLAQPPRHRSIHKCKIDVFPYNIYLYNLIKISPFISLERRSVCFLSLVTKTNGERDERANFN